ncbi:MAG: hypothetical protein JRJ29_14835 [Deltaproteobacteria bacterium]|nr:hypothetical protein [Deltaproteobacteria bacterium]
MVLLEDIKGMTGYDLVRWCRERLASCKTPHHIQFKGMLPDSKLGKPLRRQARGEEGKPLEKGKWEEALDTKS